MKLFKNGLKIWVISTLCSAVPFGYLSMLFGIPAVLLSTIVVVLVFKKELS